MANELVNVSKQMIASNEEMSTFLQKLKDQTIPLFPDTVNFGVRPEFKLSATIVKVDPNNPRDVYPVDGGKVALHLNKINEIAQAADLKITDSRILEREVDERGRVVYINHQVKWEMKSIDGTTKTGVATGKYDYYNDLATKKEGVVKSRRKHAEALAESNARTRAFNMGVAKLSQAFDKKELAKPFLIPCVVQDFTELLKDLPEDEQLRLKKLYAAKQMGVGEQLYPSSQPSSGALPPSSSPGENVNSPDEKTGSVKMVKKEDVQDADFTEESFSKAEIIHIRAEEHRGTPQKNRTKVILDLVKQKDYQDPNGKAITVTRIEKQSEDNQIKFIEKLMNLETKDDNAELI